MPIAVPDHPIPAGPLAVRFLSYDRGPMRAGTEAIVSVELENAGTATWKTFGSEAPLMLSYHWLDRLGNAIVWDGARTQLAAPVAPGERLLSWLRVAVPMPPGPYRLAIDLVDDRRFWLAEVGNRPLELDVDVLPRISARSLAVSVGDGPAELIAVTQRALEHQEEPVAAGDGAATAHLGAGCVPAPDWSRRLLDTHEEGYAVAGGSIAVEGSRFGRRGLQDELAPWEPGFGRSPNWPRPLLCPSVAADAGAELPWTTPIAGLPAIDPAGLALPWICDGRIRVSIDVRALRQADRRPA